VPVRVASESLSKWSLPLVPLFIPPTLSRSSNKDEAEVIILERPCLSRGSRRVSIFSRFTSLACKRAVSSCTRTPNNHHPPVYHNSLLTPLIWAFIFWASNGRIHVKFIDSLFICVSAVTGTGLITSDLSSLTAWQQTILVILEIVGSPVMVSWFVVAFRRWGFALQPLLCVRLAHHPSQTLLHETPRRRCQQ